MIPGYMLQIKNLCSTPNGTLLNRRELASILAGLRLLQWVGDAGHAIPYGICRMVDDITSDAGAVEPLSDAEVGELVRRLG